jgi:hypothetical protein
VFVKDALILLAALMFGVVGGLVFGECRWRLIVRDLEERCRFE